MNKSDNINDLEFTVNGEYFNILPHYDKNYSFSTILKGYFYSTPRMLLSGPNSILKVKLLKSIVSKIQETGKSFALVKSHKQNAGKGIIFDNSEIVKLMGEFGMFLSISLPSNPLLINSVLAELDTFSTDIIIVDTNNSEDSGLILSELDIFTLTDIKEAFPDVFLPLPAYAPDYIFHNSSSLVDNLLSQNEYRKVNIVQFFENPEGEFEAVLPSSIVQLFSEPVLSSGTENNFSKLVRLLKSYFPNQYFAKNDIFPESQIKGMLKKIEAGDMSADDFINFKKNA